MPRKVGRYWAPQNYVEPGVMLRMSMTGGVVHGVGIVAVVNETRHMVVLAAAALARLLPNGAVSNTQRHA
jgi:hypothetical protein